MDSRINYCDTISECDSLCNTVEQCHNTGEAHRNASPSYVPIQVYSIWANGLVFGGQTAVPSPFVDHILGQPKQEREAYALAISQHSRKLAGEQRKTARLINYGLEVDSLYYRRGRL